jgi:hypothetical protein
MSDYQYAAQTAHEKSRRPGDPTWLELPIEQRDMLAEFARAIEDGYRPSGEDYWCPNCDDLRDELREAEDVTEELREEIAELRKQLPVGSSS